MIRKTIMTMILLSLMITPVVAEAPGFLDYGQHADITSMTFSFVGIFDWFFDILNSKTANLFIPLLILIPILTIYVKTESIDIMYIMIVFSASLIKVYFMADFSNVLYWLIVLPLSVAIYKVLMGRQ